MPSQDSKVARVCEFCGAGFEVRPFRVRQGGGRFCSRSCVAKNWHSKRAPGPSIERTCETCGRAFRVHPWRVRAGRDRFCSHSCYTTSRSGHRPGATETRSCAHCGAQFTVPAREDKRFCCLDCARVGARVGTTRGSGPYEQWRATVFERDNYTCQRCGKKPTRLLAHHIKSYEEFPALRTEPSNGLTLCNPCHRWLHEELQG